MKAEKNGNGDTINKILMVSIAILLSFVLYFVKKTDTRVDTLSKDMVKIKVDIGVLKTVAGIKHK